jgi:uncharacterized protein YndB with AHSA1/START domain
MTDGNRIEVDQFLPYSPRRVWRALVDPQQLSRWLMPNDFEPRVGHRFTFRTTPKPMMNFAGVIQCEVLDVDPEKLLRISWVDRAGSGLDSTVTWRLEPEGRGTRLMLEHAGFDLSDPIQRMAQRALDGGWRSVAVTSLLQALVAQDAVLLAEQPVAVPLGAPDRPGSTGPRPHRGT